MSIDCSDDSIIMTQEQKLPSIENKAHDLMLKGRQLNESESFNQEAFNILSKAIKLNPHLLEAWIELTKCYQKKLDIDGAIACLENALKYCDSEKPNKIILRKLSICIRQKECNSQEAKIATLLRSLDLSKQALKCDMFDEENYYNLAKAYLCLFFATECVDQQLINLSKAAYVKALSLSNETHAKSLKNEHNPLKEDQSSKTDTQYKVALTTSPNEGAKMNKETHCGLDDGQTPFIKQSDFLFNFSTVLVYLQEFQKAIEYLRVAIDLDKNWNEPKNLEECLVDYLKQIHLMLNDFSKNSKKVVKRYAKIVESLNNTEKIESIILLDQQRLSKSLKVRVKSVDLNHLIEINKQDSNNKETNFHLENKNSTQSAIIESSDNNVVNLLHLKLVSTINYNQAMYLTFVAIDHNYTFIVLTIYNLAASRCPSSKDIITIVEPKIEEINVDNLINIPQLQSQSKESGGKISYKRISVREFKSLYVNGFRINADQVSKPQFKVSIIP